MHKKINVNTRVNRRNIICYVILVLIIVTSCITYIYKNYSSIYTCFATKNDMDSGVSHLSIPQFTVCGSIYRNEDIATSMQKNPSELVRQLGKTTKIPVNKILIENFGDYDAKNAYIDIVIDSSCIEYLQKFITDNNIDFKFSITSTIQNDDRNSLFTSYKINYASLDNAHRVKNTSKTQFIPTIRKHGNSEIAIPPDLYLFIRIVAHLEFFYKESFSFDKVFKSPIQIIITEYNGKNRTVTTNISQIATTMCAKSPNNPDEITYFFDVATKDVTRKY